MNNIFLKNYLEFIKENNNNDDPWDTVEASEIILIAQELSDDNIRYHIEKGYTSDAFAAHYYYPNSKYSKDIVRSFLKLEINFFKNEHIDTIYSVLAQIMDICDNIYHIKNSGNVIFDEVKIIEDDITEMLELEFPTQLSFYIDLNHTSKYSFKSFVMNISDEYFSYITHNGDYYAEINSKEMIEYVIEDNIRYSKYEDYVDVIYGLAEYDITNVPYFIDYDDYVIGAPSMVWEAVAKVYFKRNDWEVYKEKNNLEADLTIDYFINHELSDTEYWDMINEKDMSDVYDIIYAEYRMLYLREHPKYMRDRIIEYFKTIIEKRTTFLNGYNTEGNIQMVKMIPEYFIDAEEDEYLDNIIIQGISSDFNSSFNEIYEMERGKTPLKEDLSTLCEEPFPYYIDLDDDDIIDDIINNIIKLS